MAEVKTPSGLQTLGDLYHRLQRLEQTKDFYEASNLLSWMQEGGLETLKPSLMTYLEEMRAVKPDVINSRVRLFTQWKETPFQAASLNTVAELKAALAKEFGIPIDQFVIRSKEHGTLRENEQLGTIFKYEIDNKLSPELVISALESRQGKFGYPSVERDWFENDKGEFTAPVIVGPNKFTFKGEHILVPLTRNTTMGQFRDAVSRIVGYPVRGPYYTDDYTGKRKEFDADVNVFNRWLYELLYEPLFVSRRT